MQPYFLPLVDPLAEIVPLEHLLHGDTRIQAQDLFKGHLAEPVTIEDNLCPCFIQNLECLRSVGFSIGNDSFAAQGGAGRAATGGCLLYTSPSPRD